MDDIIIVLLCRNPDEEAAAEAFVSELSKPTVYPPPLCLHNAMAPQGDQEFMEAKLCDCGCVEGGQLALSLNNKVTADILYRLPPYRQRLSPKMSRAANRTVASLLEHCSLQGLVTVS